MQLTEAQVIKIKQTLVEGEYLAEGNYVEDGQWRSQDQSAYDQYIRSHHDVEAETLAGKQPGVIEQLGGTLAHAVSLDTTWEAALAAKENGTLGQAGDDASAAKAAKAKAEKEAADKAEAEKKAQEDAEAAERVRQEQEAEAQRVRDAEEAAKRQQQEENKPAADAPAASAATDETSVKVERQGKGK